MKKVGIIAGTRPEAIKLIPVYLELKKTADVLPIFIASGQHREMLDQVFQVFELEPEYSLDLMTEAQSLHELSARLLEALGPLFRELNLDLVMVQGDTSSAFMAALAAYYEQIPVAHVEAGLRTGDKYAPFPEEMNRKLISGISDLNFTPTRKASEILQAEGCTHVEEVGNTVIDSVLHCKAIADTRVERYLMRFPFLDPERRLIGITAHRRENFGEGLVSICRAIRHLCERHQDCDFVFPVHLNPQVQKRVYEELNGIGNLYLLGPVDYDEWVYLMSRCTLVLTDSGGIQEEAPALDVPVVVMRNKTERPEGISTGAAVLAGTSEVAITAITSELLENEAKLQEMKQAENPFGDGKSSERIAHSVIAFLES